MGLPESGTWLLGQDYQKWQKRLKENDIFKD